MSLEKNSVHISRITGYTSEGSGVARIDGMAVFVPAAVEGELCRIKILKVTKKFAYGKIEEILELSSERKEPVCPYFPKCGGCDFQHMSYSHELELKAMRVRDAFERLGGKNIGIPEIVGSPDIHRSRNKASFPVGREMGKVVYGLYAHASNRLIPVKECILHSSAINKLASAVCDWANENSIGVWRDEGGLLRHIVIREAEGLQLCLVVSSKNVPHKDRLISACLEAAPDLKGIYININSLDTNRIFGDKLICIYGEERLNGNLAGNTLALSPVSFYQVNRKIADMIYADAVKAAAMDENTDLVDLYCGAGSTTLAFAPHCNTAVGVEIVPEAVSDAVKNAEINGIENVRFICEDAGKAASEIAESGKLPDIVVCDPPRKGLDPQGIEAILRISPKRIVYISCDPATLARDVNLLTAGGYELKFVKCYDMFPRTANVETLCLLSACGKGDNKYEM